MNDSGYIWVHRSILSWEWYTETNTFKVFLHLLIKANWQDGRFRGKEVKRGQLITTIPQLSKELKLSIQQVRTALEHLKSTGEISTDGIANRYTVITIEKYDVYQRPWETDNTQSNRPSTDEQQTINRPSTLIEKRNKEINKNINNKVGEKRFTPPSLEEVQAYCQERGNNVNPERFVNFYSMKGWMVGKNKMKDWKAAVRTWEKDDKKKDEFDPMKYLEAMGYDE